MSKAILAFRDPINLINNLTTNIAGLGALDAIIGKLLDDKINNAKHGMLPFTQLALTEANPVTTIDKINNPTKVFGRSGFSGYPYCMVVVSDYYNPDYGGGAMLVFGFTYESDGYGIQSVWKQGSAVRIRSKVNNVWEAWKYLGGYSRLCSRLTQLLYNINTLFTRRCLYV